MIVHSSEAHVATRYIKCLVWDLDHTLWDGILLEDANVNLREGVVNTIKTLDERGILHSIASKNDPELAKSMLAKLGLASYFLYPQINWNAKSSSIRAIAEMLNIGMDAIAFIDDQIFEREEVAFALPDVFCLDAILLDKIVKMPEFTPKFVTAESAMRRQMYQSDMQRKEIEKNYVETDQSFLATLDMHFVIKVAREEDLQRAEELTLRTHQLNTTGYTYSYDELNEFRLSPNYSLWTSSLEDRYGPYGTIGLVLVQKSQEVWTIKLLLMSCRVMSRGVGSVMLGQVMRMAKQAGVKLQAEFLPNERNKMMFITFKFGGFKEVSRSSGLVVLEHNLEQIPAVPDYLRLTFKDIETDQFC